MSGHDRESTLNSVLDRRAFLRLAGAGAALAGLDGCSSRMPAAHILPYVDNRPELSPGIAQHYATAMTLDGIATGLIVESHDGRPTKVEGNPNHPASLGATGPIEQASVLQLYDPDRAQKARIGRAASDWRTIAATLAPNALRATVGGGGPGLHLLVEPTSSPFEEALLSKVLEAHPDARIYMYAPLSPDRSTNALVPHYDFSAADVIFAVDSDVLAAGPFHLRYARQFADRRRLGQPSDAMNRLYVAESGFTPTGSAADHRFPTRPSEIGGILAALDAILGGATDAEVTWLRAIAQDLAANRGRSVVVVNPGATPAVRAHADSINAKLGAFGKTAWYAPSPLIGSKVPIHSLDALVTALDAKQVDTLVIVGGNPVYATPSALRLDDRLKSAGNVGYVGLYENETAARATWFVPMSHYLETWGDARAYDGTLSIVQPLVNPLYESIAASDVYASLAGVATGTTYDRLRESWRARGESDDGWNDALERGFVSGSAFAAQPAPSVVPQTTAPDVAPRRNDDLFDVTFEADPKVHDGSFANNGWLQELPAPITTLTWGNAAHLSPASARALGLANGDRVLIENGSARTTTSAIIVPGHGERSITLQLGYGRSGAERAAAGVGVNAYELWPAVGTRHASGARVSRASGSEPLALVQPHVTMDVSHPVRSATLTDYRSSPNSVGQRTGRVLTLYPGPTNLPDSPSPNQWAMTIDLNTCIGCGACTVACQAENNIPVVGAEEVRRGRAMHWIRIERYFAEREQAVEALLQPMLCQHCEKAPCEYVCPVDATVHSDDGLNEMVYNRCVGTRFCSNNCPYKVRRFNWFDYNRSLSETEMMGKNPNVTVRERGVMEKCTFCVQRIREGEIAAARDNRALRGSDVMTACQQACPTNAIVFGSLTERDSELARRRAQPRAYAALDDLGTEPRVQYLARVRNVNSALPSAE